MFGLQDQFLHAAQGRIGADLGNFDIQRAGQVDRAAEDISAHVFVHRQRLARDGGLVDRAAARHDAAVAGDVVSGPHAHDVAGDQVFGFDFNFAAAAHYLGRVRRRQADERFDTHARAQGATALDQVGQKHKKRDRSRRQIVSNRIGPAADRASGKRRQHAERRQLVHHRLAGG